jgi:HYDIN/CFA65/VesB-like, Ig-like domain/Immunoglobulin domain/Cep192 domain 4/Immunoglobulin I-set domain
MRISRRIEGNILNALMIGTLLFFFGTTALANMTANPSVLNFGSQAVGTTSAPISVTITNTNKRNIKVYSASISGAQFSYSGLSLPIILNRGQSLTASVTFTPATANTYSGTLAFTLNNGPKTYVALSGTGVQTQSQPPAITVEPSSQTIAAGQTATFSVAATGTAPMKFQWKKNATAITGATFPSYTTPAETTVDNNSQFTVTISNSAGNATSNAAALTVNAAAVAPAITTQPSSQTVTAGQTATFNVAATGTSPMAYQWEKNAIAITGATSSTYTTPVTTTSDNAEQFTVVLSNAAGSITSTAAILTVKTAAVAPAITAQPVSKTVTAGQTATFSVAATGTSPMTYQWKKNSTAISGATSSSYTTPAETVADNSAQFTVTVGNSAGSAASNPATLTVNAGTMILNGSPSALNFGNVNVSGNSRQNDTLTNAGTSNVTISNVGISGAGFGASGVPTGLILSPGQTATLTATFSPSTSGSMTGSVTVASDASNSPDTIALSGTGVIVVNHSAALSWTASTSAVIGYNAYSGTKPGGPYTKLTPTPTPGTSYTDSTVQTGLTYYYVVTAVDSAGTESPYSNEVSATIP